MPKTPAKYRPSKKTPKNATFPLDTNSEKPRPGRPFKIKASWVRARAENYRLIFAKVWKEIWPRFSKAATREDVITAFQDTQIATGYALEFVIMADLILLVLHDPDFPKRKREAQINFLADSIAGHGRVTARSSRDICERERKRIKRAHHIIRYEFWIECSCGYKGLSLNHACQKCEAGIPLPVDSPMDASCIFQILSRRT